MFVVFEGKNTEVFQKKRYDASSTDGIVTFLRKKGRSFYFPTIKDE